MTEQLDPESRVADVCADLDRLRTAIATRVVGQAGVLEGVITCLLSGGHALLEGVPGVGKTLLVRSVADALALTFTRVQFTPDLMPADIVGTTVLREDEHGLRRFDFERGPVFTNILLADEINRATPKTQSALLEVMQERTVTVSGTTHVLDEPYCVLATQNPLEMEGTYPLPEAQLDRFMLKLRVEFPSHDELHAILERTSRAATPMEQVLSRERLREMRAVVDEIVVPQHVREHAVRLLEATHPGRAHKDARVSRFVRYGASPRGAQAMLSFAKVRALTSGRFAVSVEDVRAAVQPALGHRMILNFEGEAEGVDAATLLEEVLAAVPARG